MPLYSTNACSSTDSTSLPSTLQDLLTIIIEVFPYHLNSILDKQAYAV